MSLSRFLIPLFITALFLTGCGSSGPEPPKPGSAAYNWNAAQEAYKSGDYAKANDLLVKLSEKQNEFTAQAQPLALVFTHGLTHAYVELWEKFEKGAKYSRASAPAFRRQVNEYRAKATAAGMQFAEITRLYNQSPASGDVVFAFDFPQGLPDPPTQYQSIEQGQMVPPQDMEAMERHVIQHEILFATCRAAGDVKDRGKAKALWQNGQAKLPRATYAIALAEALFQTGEMFGPKKLSQPNRIIIVLYEEGLKALAPLPDNKEAQALAKKIKDAQKTIKSAL